MQACATIQELRKQFRGVNSGCAGDTIFGAKALMFLCELAVNKNGHKKRKASAWQRFFSRGMKAGKSPKQIAKEWRG